MDSLCERSENPQIFWIKKKKLKGPGGKVSFLFKHSLGALHIRRVRRSKKEGLFSLFLLFRCKFKMWNCMLIFLGNI